VTNSELYQWMADECIRLAHQNAAERTQLLKAAQTWANLANAARLTEVKNEPLPAESPVQALPSGMPSEPGAAGT
jgi:hypothetical protein